MVSPILLKRSLVSGVVPSSLAAGELAQNLPDEMLFFRNPGGVVTPLKLPDGDRFIARGSLSAAANLTLSVDPAVIGVFRAFRLHLTDWRYSVSGNNLRFRMGTTSGINSGASDYEWGHIYSSYGNGSFFSSNADASDSSMQLTEIFDVTSTMGGCGSILFGTNDPAAAVRNIAICTFGTSYSFSGDNVTLNVGYGARRAQIALTQVQVFHNSATITGKYELIGIP